MKAGIAPGSKQDENKGHRGHVPFFGEKLPFFVARLVTKTFSTPVFVLWKLCYLIPHYLRMVKMLEIKITRTYLQSLISINQVLMMMKLMPQMLG